MSLHLGNLPPRIRKDELERLFRQFGRCSLLLKDGYGFAKYDFEGDAEVALRALKGRKICGQTLDLSWSDKQRRPLPRFAKADKSHGMMQLGRNLERNHYNASHNFPESHGSRQKFTGPHEDRVRLNRTTGNHDNCNQNKEFIRVVDRIQLNQVDTERWSDGVHNLRNGKGKDIDKQMGFDRYRPDCVDEGFVEYDGNHGLGQLPGSPSGRTASDKYKRIHHHDNTRGSQTCFNCGAVGHKVRDCPKIRAPNEVGGPGCRSTDSLLLSNRYPKSAIQHESSQVINNGKKRREREDLSKELSDRKVRRSGLSHPHSDQTSPKLSTHSRSQEPLSMAGSLSVSRSPLPHLLSVSPRSEANSQNSRSGSMKSKPRSRSCSRSYARSPSRNEEQVNWNGALSGSLVPCSKEVLDEINKLFEPDDEENSPMENGTDALSENQQPELDLVDYDPISPDRPNTSSNEPLDDEELPQSKEVVLEKNDDSDATAAELSVEKQSVAGELKNDAKEKLSVEPVNIPDRNAPSSSGTSSRLSVSGDEVNRVFKHYGLKHLDYDDHIDTVEDYFGCARMWPWEMIYYRRHKKGLVSAENHAQRVAQNRAFGIVDKYIRSSSGWFEQIKELP